MLQTAEEIEVQPEAIYRMNMPAASWQLLWWLICRMDDRCEVHGGWRVAAARDFSKDRIWVGRCAEILHEKGLIDTAPRSRWAKVLVQKIQG